MRVALVCPTVGQTQRGYERFCVDLQKLLRGDVDLTLFKGAGMPSSREIVVPHLSRTGIMSQVFRQRLRYPRYHLEFLTFVVAMLPHLRRGRFDLIHFIDPPLARYFFQLRRFVPHPYALLFTDAGPVSYDASRWVNYVHCINPASAAEAARLGLTSEQFSLVPVGLNPAAFTPSANRVELRRRYGIPDSTFVVLSVTTLNRQHKRVDYLIEEASKLDGDFVLWLDGSLHPDGDPTLLTLAADRLGSRFRHTHVPSSEVGDLFRTADVMVSSALSESFGMAIAEAMCAGLPVVTHDSPHFRWLVRSPDHMIDMSKPGNLATHLAAMMKGNCSTEADRQVLAASAISRFAWDHLKCQYLEMYQNALAARQSSAHAGS